MNTSTDESTNVPDRDDGGRAAFVRHWQRVGPLLEKIRDDELRNLDEATRLTMIDDLLQLGAAAAISGEPQTTSGLVEMQRLFQKLHR